MPKKVRTSKQRTASRANGRKSKGPKTSAGKTRSRLNAVRHGLLSEHLIFPGDPVEHADDFGQLVQALFKQLKPAGPLDELVIQRVAAAHWRLRRAYRFEARAIADYRDAPRGGFEQFVYDINGTTPPPNAEIPPLDDLDKLVRYEGLIERELSRAMSQLERLRRYADRANPTSPPPQDADSGDANP